MSANWSNGSGDDSTPLAIPNTLLLCLVDNQLIDKILLLRMEAAAGDREGQRAFHCSRVAPFSCLCPNKVKCRTSIRNNGTSH